MAQLYAQDLRERVIDAVVRGGMGRPAAAARSGVSAKQTRAAAHCLWSEFDAWQRPGDLRDGPELTEAEIPTVLQPGRNFSDRQVASAGLLCPHLLVRAIGERSMGAIETYGWEWGSALIRWLHVTAAIAWIGGSFFFMHLDASLAQTRRRRSGDRRRLLAGARRRLLSDEQIPLAPPSLPEELIWPKWESYWTWMSGFALLCWVYYGQSTLFLIDPAVMPLEPWQAAADRDRRRWRSAGLSMISCAVRGSATTSRCSRSSASVMSSLTSWVFTLVFSGRGALIHTGALMATMMTGNVFFVIMPNQRKSVAALMAGKKPDPKWAKTSKTRSTHNNYITLPVLFLMLSNHYPMTFSNPRVIPAIVTCVIVAGALVRYFYNAWHLVTTGAVVGLGVAAALRSSAPLSSLAGVARHARAGGARGPAGRARRRRQPKAPPEVVEIVMNRCIDVPCRGPMDGIGEAPKGVLLDTPEHIAQFAPAIRMQAVLTHAMPPNNFSQMTDDERAVLARWFKLDTAQN